MYFSNSQPSRDLPTPAGPDTSTSRGTRRSAAAWNSSLTVRSSASRPISGASSPSTRCDPPTPASTRVARHRSLRLRLALQRVLPGIGEPDRAARQPLRRPIDQHLPRLGRRLHPGGGVHRIPGHHPLTGRAQRDRHLTGHHPRPRRQTRHPRLRPQLAHRGHQIQRGAHRPLRVPLRRHRRPPHRHHRIPDELLHHPAIPADHRPRHLEIRATAAPAPPPDPATPTAG